MSELEDFYYSISEDGIFEEDPEQVALDYFNYNGYEGEVIQVYIGESYIPTNQDELDWMEGEGFKCLIKNVEPYAKYKYDLENDNAIEVQG